MLGAARPGEVPRAAARRCSVSRSLASSFSSSDEAEVTVCCLCEAGGRVSLGGLCRMGRVEGSGV